MIVDEWPEVAVQIENHSKWRVFTSEEVKTRHFDW